ncbi:restriction endonuclease subunit S [Campylobacter lanienae]|uniref:restriction endonuclease subunit S n=1 Tax=Campylobacter lanienae TaxID=75658 RepID=UPI0011AC2294|nr:restriction endonuclease subunit S [Campylobacter lanienae]TWO13826.1 restriction endonuclease subunit S [Campylobacter lanienae]
MMNKIPKGWEVKKLGEIFNIVRGGSPRPIKSYLTDDKNGINWIKIGDIETGSKYITHTKQKILASGLKKSRAVKAGDLLLTNSMSFGRPYISKINGAVHDGWLIFEPKIQISKDYVFYFFSSSDTYSKLSNLAVGSTVKNLQINFLENFEIPLPPLSEQKAIADKLDDSFAKIENAITNLINAKENLKLYKQSVLKSAFNGDLLPNTSPTHWEVKKLGEICEITMGQSPKGENVFENSQSLNGLEFHQGKICFTDKFISKSKFITSDIRKIAEVGSILLCVRAPVGVINLTERKIAIGRGLCALKANNQNNNFLYYYLLGLKQYFESKATGSTFSAITLNIVKNCEIPLPPLSEQNLIVAEIDRRFAIVDKTLNLIDKSIQNAKNLKQSILKKAFSGELRSEI